MAGKKPRRRLEPKLIAARRGTPGRREPGFRVSGDPWSGFATKDDAAREFYYRSHRVSRDLRKQREAQGRSQPGSSRWGRYMFT